MEYEPRKEWLEAVTEFYKSVLYERELSLDEAEILTTTCDRLQRFHLARLQIEKEGMTFTSKTDVIKTHPLLAVERQAYTGFLSGCKLLDLSPEEKRPAHRPTRAQADNYRSRGRRKPSPLDKFFREKREPEDEF
ncbi:MAG: P27 family phage terminase small subunit [Deltaproteobacteria bacterium]|nr:P27 family phage terminase small subunit [Deltaproteobacteria bacterium]MBW1826684.1 P27 family phage terminase small subunit [Deltaproteobacteria bacterium]